MGLALFPVWDGKWGRRESCTPLRACFFLTVVIFRAVRGMAPIWDFGGQSGGFSFLFYGNLVGLYSVLILRWEDIGWKSKVYSRKFTDFTRVGRFFRISLTSGA
jgi:hypothetical protein